MTDAIERTLDLAASPERVWKALTDPEELAAWFPDETIDLDVRSGGGGWWRWSAHGRFAVRFEVVDPPRRLVWSWARDPEMPVGQGPTTRVEWTLEPRTGGGTTLRLRESGFVRPEDRRSNEAGWDHELGELRDYLGRQPSPRC
jgi:uncharacterized protein YndB with AHSA1/START domain